MPLNTATASSTISLISNEAENLTPDELASSLKRYLYQISTASTPFYNTILSNYYLLYTALQCQITRHLHDVFDFEIVHYFQAYRLKDTSFIPFPYGYEPPHPKVRILKHLNIQPSHTIDADNHKKGDMLYDTADTDFWLPDIDVSHVGVRGKRGYVIMLKGRPCENA